MKSNININSARRSVDLDARLASFERVTGTSRDVAPASLAVFRIALGLTLVVSCLRIVAFGWLDTLYEAPAYQFTYWGFGWLPRPRGGWLTLHVAGIALSGAALALGVRTRWSALAAFTLFTWFELLDKTLYLNHYYAVSLFLLWFALTPTGTDFSLDAYRRGGQRVRADVLCAFRVQVAVIYVFAGVAKLDSDWLLRAEPLRTWLLARPDFPLLGGAFAHPQTAYLFSWSGALFDLLVVPALLCQRTRPWAFASVVGFHTLTGSLFPIGVFPLVMIAAATLFFAPDWPRRLSGCLSSRGQPLAGPPEDSHDPARCGAFGDAKPRAAPHRRSGSVRPGIRAFLERRSLCVEGIDTRTRS